MSGHTTCRPVSCLALLNDVWSACLSCKACRAGARQPGTPSGGHPGVECRDGVHVERRAFWRQFEGVWERHLCQFEHAILIDKHGLLGEFKQTMLVAHRQCSLLRLGAAVTCTVSVVVWVCL